MNSIFLSYSHQDAGVADFLFDRLTGAGFKVWRDDPGLRLGTPFVQEISKALAEHDCFMVLLTSAALGSEWVKKEIDMAMVSGRKILPILLEDVPIPPHLATLQYLPMKGGAGDWTALHKLVNSLDGGAAIPRIYNMSGHPELKVKGALLLGAGDFAKADLNDPSSIVQCATGVAQAALPYIQQAGAGIVPHGHPALASAILAYLLGVCNQMPKLFYTFRNPDGTFEADGAKFVDLQDIREAGFHYRSGKT